MIEKLVPDVVARQMPHRRRRMQQELERMRQQKENKKKAMLDLAANWIRGKHSQTVEGALAFVPWIIQQAHHNGELGENVVVHRGIGAVVFSDASGFTALTEKLAQKSNGAELLSQCLTSFFTPLIDIISSYRGDVIKFSGDALTIYFPAVEDAYLDNHVPPCGTYGCEGHTPEELSTLRASACCIEIHRRLHMFDTGVDGVRLCLHIGVGYGDVTILQVGGEVPPETKMQRYEYVICGPPMEQISIAEPLASNGETVLSPEAWQHVAHTVIEGEPLEKRPEFHRLVQCDPEQHTFPVLKAAALETDMRGDYRFTIDQIDICRRYIPSAVFKQIAGGTLTYVNEMRNLSVIFINVQGVDVSTETGSVKADKLMKGVQKCCNAHEGTLNKFLVDDKGMLFLLCFGLPPLVHKDDAIRAILCCMDIRKVMKSLKLIARFGVTTGRNYCGVVGSASRMEYTVLGDSVNLSARLMANAKEHGILVGEKTYELSREELEFNILAPILVKGKTALIPIFEPTMKPGAKITGIHPTESRVCFPWIPSSSLYGGDNHMLKLQTWRELIIVQRLLKETDKEIPAAHRGRNQRREVVSDTKTGSPGGSVGLKSYAKDDEEGAGGTRSANRNVRAGGERAPNVSVPIFESGGALVLCGGHGLGKVELLEYVANVAWTKYKLTPLIASSGVRPGEHVRVLSEFFKSLLSAFRRADPTLPRDNDIKTIERVCPPDMLKMVGWLGALLGWEEDDETNFMMMGDDVKVRHAIELLRALTNKVLREQPVCALLRFERGSNIFTETDHTTFWLVAEALLQTSREAKQNKHHGLTIVLCIRDRAASSFEHVMREYQRECEERGCWIDTEPFSEVLVGNYISTELAVPLVKIPRAFTKYVAEVTLGNPLFIREALRQLESHGHMSILDNPETQDRELRCEDNLDEIVEVALWPNTHMIGGVLAILESLDPLPASIVKMATVFQGSFNISDLLASACSRWSGAARFEALRLFFALNQLVQLQIVNLDIDDEDALAEDQMYAAKLLGPFRLSNVLVRKVAGSMVLEAQKKSVKRQALMDRCLAKDLPERMEAVRRKKLIPHIPWYYQIELPQGASKKPKVKEAELLDLAPHAVGSFMNKGR